jgi:hypothetical protein
MNWLRLFSIILFIGVGMLVFTQFRKYTNGAGAPSESSPSEAAISSAPEVISAQPSATTAEPEVAATSPVQSNVQSNEKNPTPAPKDVCNDIVKRLRPVNETCLIFDKPERRRHCVASVPNQLEVREPVWRGCQAYIEPIRIEYLAKEKQKFPKQVLAFSK